MIYETLTTMRLPVILWTLIAPLLIPAFAEARLTRITAGPPTVIDFPSFGATGPYMKIAGTFEVSSTLQIDGMPSLLTSTSRRKL